METALVNGHFHLAGGLFSRVDWDDLPDRP
jgi:hypothetical protein